MSETPAHPIEDLEAKLKDEFLADARDRLAACHGALHALAHGGAGDPQHRLTLDHEVHALKSMSSSFGFPSITLIAGRLADYLGDLEEPGERALADIQLHLDRLSDIAESGRDLGEGVAEVVRALPQRGGVDFGEIELRDVEVLVVTPSRAVGRGVGRELAACGYRVAHAQGAVEAIRLAATARPEMVIAAATLDLLSGFDLVRALAAMDATRAIRSAILTSFGDDHPELRRLPLDIGIVRLGDQLRDDLGALLADYEASAAA